MPTLGILGGGQLARMLAMAAFPLGIKTLCLDPTPNVSASVVTEVVLGDYENNEILQQFANRVDHITVETENIPCDTLEYLHTLRSISPAPLAIALSQDRFLEKSLCRELEINTPAFIPIDSLDDLQQGLTQLGTPALLKTRRFGYDGKGQYLIREPLDATTAWDAVQKSSSILEAFVPFDFEVSLISVRDKTGAVCFYPLTKNLHREGILRFSIAPFIDEKLQNQAQQFAKRLLQRLNYVGVLTIEFFVLDQELLVNELAPRVHNSGHWTIEGAQTSQFANHVRAVMGLPLGETGMLGHSAMFNSISVEPSIEEVLAIPGAHYHTYDKTPRLNRKLGHVTLVNQDQKAFQEGVTRLDKLFEL
jgi:5-(carboxyamino)imidazole ribonucleotide synthase